MKTTNDAKFSAGDVTSPSKRFAFDGLKLSWKKKASLYKNWLLRRKEVAHKHRLQIHKSHIVSRKF